MTYTVERRIRVGLPQVGYAPYNQIHAHSTGNPKSTAQNEADYFHNKDINSGFYTHVVGNGRVIQVGEVNRGAWDVGGGWNAETYAAVELIESHATKEEFMADYKIYCELLKDLATQAGLPITVDTADLQGIKTHNYCTGHQPANGSDHVDPLPYLTKWGITLEQFRKDVTGSATGGNDNEDIKPNLPKKGQDNMIFAFNINGKGATYLFDGVRTIAFANKDPKGNNAKLAWEHYQGTFKEITGKAIPTQTKTQEQANLWFSLYPAQFIKF